MKQTEVIALLHNIVAGHQEYTTWTVSTPHLVMLVQKAVEAEREACAKVANLVAREIDDTNGTATYIADAIRARGQE